uniref:(northern house mosquito) hypothetical protein n=1 Tax=Culex pipiens TaxID=7175 RepID=A0A8D8AVR2_CULPI
MWFRSAECSAVTVSPKAGSTRGQSVTRTLAATTSTDGDKPQQYPKPIFSVLCNFCTHTPGAWFYGGVQRRSLLEEKNTLRTSNCSLCTELETAENSRQGRHDGRPIDPLSLLLVSHGAIFGGVSREREI